MDHFLGPAEGERHVGRLVEAATTADVPVNRWRDRLRSPPKADPLSRTSNTV
jgi:hypothetical protein